MRKSSAIRAAMRLRKWCANHQCRECPFNDNHDMCILTELGRLPCEWPAMSFGDKGAKEDATD